MKRDVLGKFVMVCAGLLCAAGCAPQSPIDRKEFIESLPKICIEKFQATVTCREIGNTLWVYLPYTPGRSGMAATAEKENDLYVEYMISSMNPYRTLDPPELKFLAQKLLGQVRQLALRCKNPYTYYVLVVTDISSPLNKIDQWYIAYLDDIKRYKVGLDFSDEGYSRLTWSQETIGAQEDAPQDAGQDVAQGAPQDVTQEKAASYGDVTGKHVNYHEITLKEFVLKQIAWRVYKRFTVEYNKTPFNLTPDEKKQAIIHIVKRVLSAYNFKEFSNAYFRDSSFLEQQQKFMGVPLPELQKLPAKEIDRKPAF